MLRSSRVRRWTDLAMSPMVEVDTLCESKAHQRPPATPDANVSIPAGPRIGTDRRSVGHLGNVDEARTRQRCCPPSSNHRETRSSRPAVTGSLMTWNGGASALFGYTSAEMIGEHLSLVLPIGRDDDVRHVFASALRGDTVDNVDTRGQRSDGTDVHVALSVSPIRSRSGEIIGTSAIARDVTERVEFLEQIEAERRHLAVAQASARLGSFEIDLATGKVVRSDELCRILGIEPGRSTGIELDHIHPDDRERVRWLVEVASAGREAIEATYRIVRPNGEVRWVLSKTTPGRGPDSIEDHGHDARHHRASRSRAVARVSGNSRFAHSAPESGQPQQQPGVGDVALRRRSSRGGRRCRHRSLQAGQRRCRPYGRRRGAEGGRGSSPVTGCGRATRLRASAATNSSSFATMPSRSSTPINSVRM